MCRRFRGVGRAVKLTKHKHRRPQLLSPTLPPKDPVVLCAKESPG